MKKIEASIDIDAPLERVWEVITDLANYPKWNPYLKEVEGLLEPGQPLHLRVKPPGAKELEAHPKVVRCEKEHLIEWEGNLWCRGLLDNSHLFVLERLDNGQTRLRQEEVWSGILTPFMVKELCPAMRQGFCEMNMALKHQCEAA